MAEYNAVWEAVTKLNGEATIVYKASKRAKPVAFKLNDPEAPPEVVAAYINDIIKAAI